MKKIFYETRAHWDIRAQENDIYKGSRKEDSGRWKNGPQRSGNQWEGKQRPPEKQRLQK